MNTPEPVKSGLDLVGIGKVAQAIPPEVYIQTSATASKTFDSLVAPLTETTAGVGRLIRQTFDNWVETRKAIGTYTLEQALIRAKGRAERQGNALQPPPHAKTFLRALEESSLETDSVLHEMWVNLLVAELVDRNSHPRFVGILAELGPEEARLVASLRPFPTGSPKVDQPLQPWNLAVTLLCQQSLAVR
jgi:hypothetical protein